MTLQLNGLECVVLATGHSPSQDYAASQLIEYVEKSTGLKLQKVESDDDIPSSCIILGDHPAIKQIAPEIDLDSLGDENFHILVKDSKIIIAGSKVRGTLYGIYEFLEELFGIRFFEPEATLVPEHPTDMEIPEFEKIGKPAFGYRVITYLDGLDPEFSPKQRINLNPFAEPEMGGSYKFAADKMTHTFNTIVSPDKYFNEHPEYFSLVNGERIQALGQLCLTNPNVIRIATDTVLRWFAEDPDLITIGIVQNDCMGYCECDNCMAINQGNPARSLLDFCITIAKAVAESYPSKFIHTIAYTYTEEPPLDYAGKLPDNLIVVVCNMYPYRSNRTIDGDPMNERYFKNLQGWLHVAKHVFVWHYFVDFTHYFLPYPIWKTVAADLKKYKALGVEGGLLQAGIGLGLYQEFQELKMYVFYKLLWNPDLELDELVREFVDHYYGAAAPLVQRYIDDLMPIEDQDDVSLHLYVGLEGNHITKEHVVKWQSLLEEGLEIVKDDAVLKARVSKVLLSLDYAYLFLPVEYDVFLGRIKPVDLIRRKIILARFIEITSKYKITSHGEQVPIAVFLDRQKFICQEHNVLALAELAPLVHAMMASMVDKVMEHVDGQNIFKENDFILSTLKRGFQPLELAGWMTSKRFAVYDPSVPDNWHRRFDVDIAKKLLNPPVPNVKRSKLPAMVLNLIKGLPGQRDTLDE
jgi:hypothetical protein